MSTRVVVLAAGKGTRMNSNMPKALTLIKGEPMVEHLLRRIRSSGVDPRPVVVIGYQSDLVRKTLGEENDYVLQEEQLGTGHALASAESFLADKADNVIVLYGDHPLVKADTIRRFRDLHEREGCVLTVMTSTVENFEGWQKPFFDFGRIIRDASGNITAITEMKDATPEQRLIQEVNSAFYCFKTSWLWPNLKKLKNENAKGEYYLTDLVEIAIRQGEKITSANISLHESMGVNTEEHLALAEKELG